MTIITSCSQQWASQLPRHEQFLGVSTPSPQVNHVALFYVFDGCIAYYVKKKKLRKLMQVQASHIPIVL